MRKPGFEFKKEEKENRMRIVYKGRYQKKGHCFKRIIIYSVSIRLNHFTQLLSVSVMGSSLSTFKTVEI